MGDVPEAGPLDSQVGGKQQTAVLGGTVQHQLVAGPRMRCCGMDSSLFGSGIKHVRFSDERVPGRNGRQRSNASEAAVPGRDSKPKYELNTRMGGDKQRSLVCPAQLEAQVLGRSWRRGELGQSLLQQLGLLRVQKIRPISPAPHHTPTTQSARQDTHAYRHHRVCLPGWCLDWSPTTTESALPPPWYMQLLPVKLIRLSARCFPQCYHAAR